MLKKVVNIFNRDTLLHFRLAFSFFLLPIFCFAISQSNSINLFNCLIVFISLHLFIYPGSNLYNSYMDNDKGSIGGLKNPPPATKKLYYASMILDCAGLLLCLLINFKMFLLMMVYICVSKAYSWHGIRLKKYAIAGWLVVVLFQGGYTFLLVNMASENLFNAAWFTHKNIECMIIATLLIGGFYPLTQIYQHAEDSGRGDYTLSYKLGVTGTFIFSGLLFIVASLVAFHYFNLYYNQQHFITYILCILPVVLYYFYWFFKTLRNKVFADYSHAMRITMISSTCMIVCYAILFCYNHLI
jgi:1,4-dihydroxy-2-naphthoate polyprenyltransferase